jgi:hypothetical protein
MAAHPDDMSCGKYEICTDETSRTKGTQPFVLDLDNIVVEFASVSGHCGLSRRSEVGGSILLDMTAGN